MYKVIEHITYSVRDSENYNSVATNLTDKAKAQDIVNIANEAAEDATKRTTAKLTKEFASLTAAQTAQAPKE